MRLRCPIWLTGIAVIAFLVMAFMILGGFTPAEAQTVDVRPTISAALEWLAGALITVLTALGGVAIRLVLSRIGLSNSQLERDLQERLDFIVHKAIDFALLSAQNEVAKSGAGLGAVKVDNWLIKVAADQVQAAAPGILAHFKLDRAAVERIVISRVPAAAPIAQPPVPVEGGMATPPIAKQATREVGAPGSDRAASTTARPTPPAGWPGNDQSGTIG